MRKQRNKLRHIKLLFLGGFLALVLGACTPQEAVWVHFYQSGSPKAHHEAQKIVGCESNWNPNAVSPTNDHGLFQINIVHRHEFERVTGQPWSMRYDPFWNARYAKHLYDTQGWGPWACKKVL